MCVFHHNNVDAAGVITSFSLKVGTESLSGESAHLICTLDSYTGGIFIIKSDDSQNIGIALSTCDATACRSKQGYDFTSTGTTVKITIKRLQRAEHQKWWTCRTIVNQNQVSEKQFQLKVYSEYKNKIPQAFRSLNNHIRST